MASANDNENGGGRKTSVPGDPSGQGSKKIPATIPVIRRRATAFLRPSEKQVTRRDFVETSASLLLLGAGASLFAGGAAEASKSGAGDLHGHAPDGQLPP